MREFRRDLQRVWEKVESRLNGFPCFPYSVISMAHSVLGQRSCTRLIREESSRESYIHGSVYMLP
jgi:hypothetical protein